jgi:hypothetical protein
MIATSRSAQARVAFFVWIICGAALNFPNNAAADLAGEIAELHNLVATHQNESRTIAILRHLGNEVQDADDNILGQVLAEIARIGGLET